MVLLLLFLHRQYSLLVLALDRCLTLRGLLLGLASRTCASLLLQEGCRVSATKSSCHVLTLLHLL